MAINEQALYQNLDIPFGQIGYVGGEYENSCNPFRQPVWSFGNQF